MKKHLLRLTIISALFLVGWAPQAYCKLTSVAVTVNKSPADFYTDQTIAPGDVVITAHSTDVASGFGLEGWMTVKIALVNSPSGTTPIANALSVSNVNFTTGAITFNPSFKNLKPFTGSSVRYQVTVSSPDGTVLIATGSANPVYSSAINIYDMESATVTVNKSPANFFTSKTIQPGDVTIALNGVNGGDKGWMTTTIALVSAGGSTPISNALSLSDVNFTTGAITFNPSFKILKAFTGNSVRFQVTVSSANGTLLVNRTGTNPTYSAPINIYDIISASVSVNKIPAEFYTDKTIQPGDVTLAAASTDSASGFGLESWMTVKIAVVTNPSGTTPIANALSIPSGTSVNFTTGAVTFNPSFKCLTPFTGNSVRFQVTISSPDGTALIPFSGSNPAYSTGTFNVYDYVSSSISVLRVPPVFFTGKDANANQPGVQMTVNSTNSATSFGLESWMRVHVAVVPAGGSGTFSNEVTPSTLTFPTGTITTTPSFYPDAAHTGSSVRFQVTVTSANSTTPLTPKTGSGTNPAFSTAVNIYDFVSGSATVVRVPAHFFTGKNGNLNPGMSITVVSTSPTTSPDPFGLESWMRVYIAVAPNAQSTSLTNEIRPSPVAFTTGKQTASPPFYPDAPHINDSVRYQITITSSNNTNPLVPVPPATNPFFSTSVSIYDIVLASVAIVQGPDPTNAKFKVDSDINPSTSAYGVQVVLRSTEPNAGYGPEAYMHMKVELVDFNDLKVTNGLSQEDFVVPTDIPIGSPLTYPHSQPHWASYSKTAHFLVTISSADSPNHLLVPEFLVNPSTSALFTINASSPSKFVLLPMDTPLIRPDRLGRATVYTPSTPFLWSPTALGEDFRVKVLLTDDWSNPVDIPDTELEFGATQYLRLPPFNNGNTWTLDTGIKGTDFLFNFSPYEITIPISISSTTAYFGDTIYVKKFGLPTDTIFAGPSPFNPKIETIKFGFQVDQDQDMKILVLDLFGQEVWETTVHAVANVMNTSTLWNGRNSKGDLISAGVYWVILEKNGKWISKKKFGVIK